ncbi:hypothetical protein FOA52_000437 [Chlamydomonas sp. UWO 241]|nr:hypothetical protein FOA52_000437 [Chlamydomonas sp. UWO 241]
MRRGAASWLRDTLNGKPRLCAALSCIAAAVVPPPPSSEHSSSSSAAQATGAEMQPQPPTSMVFSKLDGVAMAIRASFVRDPDTACLVPELLLDLDSAGAGQVAAACVAAGAGARVLPRVDEGKVQTPADDFRMPPPVKVNPTQASNEHAPPPNSPGVSPRSASQQKMVDGLARLHESCRDNDGSSRHRQGGTDTHMQRAGSMALGMPLLATLIELRVPASGSTLNDGPCAALLALLDNTTAPADGTGPQMQLGLLGDVLLQNALSLAYWGDMQQLGEKGGPTMVRAMLPAEEAIDMLRTAAQCWRVRADKPQELPLHAPWKRALELPVCYKLQGRLIDDRIFHVPTCEQRAQLSVDTAAASAIGTAAVQPGPFRAMPGYAFTGLGMTGGMSPRVMDMLSSISMAANSREGDSKRDSWAGSSEDPPVPRHETADVLSNSLGEHARSLFARSDASL